MSKSSLPGGHLGSGGQLQSSEVDRSATRGTEPAAVPEPEPDQPGETTIRLRGGSSENVQIKRRPDHTVDGVTIIVGRSVEVVIS